VDSREERVEILDESIEYVGQGAQAAANSVSCVVLALHSSSCRQCRLHAWLLAVDKKIVPAGRLQMHIYIGSSCLSIIGCDVAVERRGLRRGLDYC
jgi:hypothetical protein